MNDICFIGHLYHLFIVFKLLLSTLQEILQLVELL